MEVEWPNRRTLFTWITESFIGGPPREGDGRASGIDVIKNCNMKHDARISRAVPVRLQKNAGNFNANLKDFDNLLQHIHGKLVPKRTNKSGGNAE